MIRFDTTEGKWGAASMAAILVALGGLGYHLIAPMPDAAEASKKHQQEQVQLMADTKVLRDEISKTKIDVQGHLWEAGPDEISAQAMELVDKLAKEHLLKVQAFRPQRTITLDEITRYPYTVVLQGAFPRMLQLVRKLQDPGTNLAVTSVQISAADGESDNVMATIGLAAFSSAREEDNGK